MTNGPSTADLKALLAQYESKSLDVNYRKAVLDEIVDVLDDIIGS